MSPHTTQAANVGRYIAKVDPAMFAAIEQAWRNDAPMPVRMVTAPALTASTPLSEAAADVASLDPCIWGDVGPALTCRETEVLADLFREAGIGDVARALIFGHARGDDEGDQHYGLEGER